MANDNNSYTHYYGVYTTEGFGVFTNLEFLEENLKDAHVYPFDSLNEASIFAITGYNAGQQLLNLPFEYSGYPNELYLNHFYESIELN